jgi:hypothetical protein
MRIARVPGDIVIAARPQLTIFWGACIVVLVLGTVVAGGNQPTATGKAEPAVFFGIFIALCAFLWWYRNRLRSRIQVTGDEIRYWYQGRHLQVTLSRQPAGAALAVIAGRYLALGGSGDRMDIRYFSRGAIRRACESCGWTFT